MACQILLDEVFALQASAPQPPYRLVLRGQVTADAGSLACDELAVQVIIDGTQATKLVAVDSGGWEAAFEVGPDLPAGLLVCGMAFKVQVACTDLASECAPISPDVGALDCRIEGMACPNATLTVEAIGDCLPSNERLVTLKAVVPGAPPSTVYRWQFGDGSEESDLLPASGEVVTTHAYAAPGPAGGYQVTLEYILPSGCPASGPLTLGPLDPCAGACPESVTLRLVDARGEVPDGCLPEGRYRVEVLEPSGGANVYSWSRDGETLASGVGLNSQEIDVVEGEPSFVVSVAIDVAGIEGCLLSGAIELEPCPGPARPCPRSLTLEASDADGRRIDTGDGRCLPAGRYRVRVVEPQPPGTVQWSRDGTIIAGATGSSVEVALGEGETVEISAAVIPRPGCPPLSDSVRLEACRCPAAPTLTVRDAAGNPVTGDCVPPGEYVVEASGEGLDEAERQWSVDGAPRADDGTAITVVVSAAQAVACLPRDGVGRLVSLTLTRPEADCPPQTVSRRLDVCRENVFDPCCWIFRLLVLLFAVLTGIAAAVWLCPQVVFNPLIPQTASLVPIAAAVAPWVTLAALAITLLLLVLWFLLCKPDLCNDLLVLAWQALIGIGFAFAYFGACPACAATLLPIGGLLLVAGVAFFIIWIASCRPSLCKIFFEIGSLGIVQVTVSWLEAFLGVCIWQYGWLLQLVFTTLLNTVGWIGTVLACRVNPNGG